MLMGIQESSTWLLECVQRDDVVGARLLLTGVGDRDRKSIVAKRGDRDPPLFVAATQGNVDMVEFLVKECHADTEERGRYEDPDGDCHLVTPLWCAAILEELEVLKVLINFGADINAASDDGSTAVLEACNTNVGIAKYLVEHGADIKKTDNTGTTCLMQAIWKKEMCQILIDYGAEVNAQDTSGNTALHSAIEILTKDYPGIEDIVQLLIDHGSDPLIKNKDGNDVFVTAIFASADSILDQLLLKFELSVKRRIEIYELHGALHFHRSSIDIEKGVACWKKAIEIRRLHSCFDVQALQPNPVYMFAREVNTMEELETLSQNHDLLRMHALMIIERILGPGHLRVQSVLLIQASTYGENGEFRRCIDIAKYAYKLQNTFAEKLFRVPFSLKFMCWRFCEDYSNNNCQIEFEEVLEVLRMVISNLNGVTGIAPSEEFQIDESLTFMVLILQLIKLITELDKNEVQLLSFKRIVHRLIRTESEIKRGQTLLHLSVKQSTSKVDSLFYLQFPCIAVVELLLECGANVNAVDNENNTVLHLCSKALRNLEMKQHHDVLTRIAVVLLKNEAHVDIVNISGESAAYSLSSCLIDFNIRDYFCLKCLAACAVLKYTIPYVGYIPASLESFVQMHASPIRLIQLF